MFLVYPHLATYSVFYEKGVHARFSMNVFANFWNISIPAYDKYGFVGYQQVDFGESWDVFWGSSHISLTGNSISLSIFYNNLSRTRFSAGDFSINNTFQEYGLSTGYRISDNFSAGFTGKISGNNRRFAGVEALLRKGYGYYMGGYLLRNLQENEYNFMVYSLISLKDERFSTLNLYMGNIHKRFGIVRYEVSITKYRRFKYFQTTRRAITRVLIGTRQNYPYG